MLRRSSGVRNSDRLVFYRPVMVDIGTRQRNQPAPPHVIFSALTDPERPGARPWLRLLQDESRPQIVTSEEPRYVVWSSIWPRRPDAIIRFDLLPGGSGTDLRWTLSAEQPIPDEALLGHLRKRMNQLINADLRVSFGQQSRAPDSGELSPA